MREDKKQNCGCIHEILRKILLLQKQEFDNDCSAGCDKPFLGPTYTTICYNTRPIMLFNCCTGKNWSFPYTLNGTTYESNVFRIEALDDCCCTCRVLYTNSDGNIVATNEFFTLDLNCVGAIKCLADASIDLC